MRLLKEGQKIKDVYEVERFLGEGAFAEVYRVKHRFLGRQAMKIFKRTGLNFDETMKLLGEALLLSKIGHPNIVKVFDANMIETPSGSCGYFTMEFVAGGTLENYWRSFSNKLIPLDQVIEVIKQICQGLTVAHSENPPIIHRDIKPQNILVGYDSCGIRIRISDFGLAKRVNPLTLLASAQGTLAFKPPEFLDEQDSTAGDVWAIGTTFYLLLTDRLPYENFDEDAFLSGERWKQRIIPPTHFNVDVDPLIESIVLKSLSHNPEHRYQDAKALLTDIIHWEKKQKFRDKYGSPSSEAAKTALGDQTPPDPQRAEKMIKAALVLANDATTLIEAADLLEEAIGVAPELREKYEYQIKLWRKGISM